METVLKAQRFRRRQTAFLGFALALSCACGGSRKVASDAAPKQSVALPNHEHKAAPAHPLPPVAAAPPRTPADASRIVQDELNRLPVGQIAFNPPSAMREAATA